MRPLNRVGDAGRIGLDRSQVAEGLPSLRLAAGRLIEFAHDADRRLLDRVNFWRGFFGASVKQFSSGIPHSREFWAMAMRLSGAHEPTIPNCHNCRRGGEAGEVWAARSVSAHHSASWSLQPTRLD